MRTACREILTALLWMETGAHRVQKVPKEGSFSLSHLFGKVGNHCRCLSRILPRGAGGVMGDRKLPTLVQEVPKEGSFSLSHLLGKVGDHDR